MSSTTGGSSTVPNTTVFDLHNEHDVVALLRRIHLSPLAVDEKNLLRDLIFSTRLAKPISVNAEVIATFAEYGFVLGQREEDVEIKVEPQVEVSGTMLSESEELKADMEPAKAEVKIPEVATTFSRTVPSFSAPASLSVHEIKDEKESDKVKTEEDRSNEAVSVTDGIDLSAKNVEIETVEEKAVEVSDSVVERVEVDESLARPPEEKKTDTVVQTPGERIAEIKRLVNARVGNPVNLIDANNEIGREYMNALLDAMKKSAGGVTEQELERAMARLERSFAAVEKMLNGGVVNTDEKPVDVTAEIESIEKTDEEKIEQKPETVSASEVTNVAEATNVPIRLVTEEEVAPSISDLTDPSTSSVTTRDEQKNIPTESIGHEVNIQAESEPEVETVRITSAAKEKQLHELMEARKAAEAEAMAKRDKMAANNPLMADDVTQGLHQLLSEWKLFKSSGIFGTGPSGHEHPLYKQLAHLTMAAVVAGRFEGATPEIKRSIADYMNGWRYEEGIIHEQGETFELYLRRVIRKILDARKKQ